MGVTIHTVTEVTFHGLELDIPEDVKASGQEAMVKWANDNIWTVNGAGGSWTETTRIISVESIDI
jgi:hypothetical protein